MIKADYCPSFMGSDVNIYIVSYIVMYCYDHSGSSYYFDLLLLKRFLNYSKEILFTSNLKRII